MSARDAGRRRRFGLGARPGEFGRIAGDPCGCVLQSLAYNPNRRLTDANCIGLSLSVRLASSANEMQ